MNYDVTALVGQLDQETKQAKTAWVSEVITQAELASKGGISFGFGGPAMGIPSRGASFDQFVDHLAGYHS